MDKFPVHGCYRVRYSQTLRNIHIHISNDKLDEHLYIYFLTLLVLRKLPQFSQQLQTLPPVSPSFSLPPLPLPPPLPLLPSLTLIRHRSATFAYQFIISPPPPALFLVYCSIRGRGFWFAATPRWSRGEIPPFFKSSIADRSVKILQLCASFVCCLSCTCPCGVCAFVGVSVSFRGLLCDFCVPNCVFLFL